MRQKSQKGFSLIELLTAVAIILIIAAIVASGLNLLNRSDFEKSFGLKTSIWQNKEEHAIIQPLVTKRLQELRNNLRIAQKEKIDLLNLPPQTVTPEETTQKINQLKEIEAKITSASYALAKAKRSAKFFGFKT